MDDKDKKLVKAFVEVLTDSFKEGWEKAKREP